jgi:MOSC domain-containing protein YiiM
VRLLSLQVGLPRTLGGAEEGAAGGAAWTSAIDKRPVHGAVWCGREGLAGDGQADRKNHGGPEKAVLASAAEHLPFWRALLGREDVGPGAFGENLLLEGLTEEGVCLGDIWACGGAVLQVSQPRLPCWKQARRWGRKDVALVMQTHGLTGWYLRVLGEGELEAGAPLTLLERPAPRWSVARANRVLHGRPADRDAATELAVLPFLAPALRPQLEALAAGEHKDPAKRLYGAG